MLPSRKIPRPIPFGKKISEEESDEHDDNETAARPRESLRRSLLQRRNSLLPHEHGFLVSLCDHGSEKDIQAAYRNLLDEDLFFETEEGVPAENRVDDPSPASSLSDSNHNASMDFSSLRAVLSTDSTALGSERRQELLEERRKNPCKMWLAHESGLSVTCNASRRSLFAKQKGRSFRDHALRSSRNLFDALLEGSGEKPRANNVTEANQSQSARAVSWGSAPALPKMERLFQSKSDIITRLFKEKKEREERKRKDSLSSIPSLHHGHPVRSQSFKSEPIFDLLEGESDDSVKLSETNIDFPNEADIQEERNDYIPKEDRRRLFTRMASRNEYSGEGFEIDFEGDKSIQFDGEDYTTEEETDHDEISTADASGASSITKRNSRKLQRPVLMRLASANFYSGEGMEVADWKSERPALRKQILAKDPISNTQRSSSFDESMCYSRAKRLFERTLRKSISDDILLHNEEADKGFLRKIQDYQHYDAWLIMDEEDAIEFGGSLPFKILGTSADDVACHPHVLSPPLMEQLQVHIPFSKRGENMWLKYSLVRDGASIHTFLKHARGATHSFLAIETVDGEVFGAYTATPWRTNLDFFGTGESFLWRMRRSRLEKSWSIIDQAEIESQIDIYRCTGENQNVQLCTYSKIALGGTGGKQPPERILPDGTIVQPHEWGFALAIDSDLLQGTTSPCITFESPPLSKVHSDGSYFEIVNMELWTLTPFTDVRDSQRLELTQLFLEKHTRH